MFTNQIYELHFNRFMDKNPTILEIGVSKGGSLEMFLIYNYKDTIPSIILYIKYFYNKSIK